MISVIVPIYNSEKYLEKCLHSICSQTIKELEIILINDGSTDSSLSICNNFKKQDSRIKVYSEKNSGVSVARNFGIKMSHGEYITFVDSDDTIESDMYELLLKNACNGKYDISSCSIKEITIKGKEKKFEDSNNTIELKNNNDIMRCFFENFIMDVSLNNKIFKRECIKDTFLNEEIKINEDKLFMYFVLKKTNSIIYQDVHKYNYYKRNSSASAQKYSSKYDDIITVAQIISDDANKNYANMRSKIKYFVLISYMNYYRLLLKRTQKFVEKNRKQKIRKEIIRCYSEIDFKVPFKRRFEIFLLKKSQYLYKAFLNFYDFINNFLH